MLLQRRVLAPVRSAALATRAHMSRKVVIPAVVVVVLAAWLLIHRSSTAAPADAAAAAPASALVKTAPLQQLDMSDYLPALGRVTTGLDVAINFPRAGQVQRLLVIQGQRVSRGTPLATLASDPNARLAYEQAVSAVDFAQGELRRNQGLLSLQLATQSQVDAARRALSDAQALLATQRQLGGAIGSATVAAPFDGVVDSVEVAQGDRVQPGAVIVQLGHTDVLRVRLGIEPEDARLVRVGMPVVLRSLNDSTRSATVTITESQGVVDPKTLLIDAVAMVPASQATFLVPGMYVRASVRVGQHRTWAAPRAAVLTDAAGAYVFQVSGSRAHRVNVTQGAESHGMVGISGAIDPRLPIVILGNYELQDGMTVRQGTAVR